MQNDLFGLVCEVNESRFSAIFRSGASAFFDAEGLVRIKSDIGVAATEVPPRTITLLRSYAKEGGKVFVDSGAFGLHTANEKAGGHKALDFSKVFEVYDAFLAELPRSAAQNIALVMPDVIGKQLETLDLLRQHRERVVDYIASGANVIVPIQRGPLRQEDNLERVVEILGTRDFRIGIPTKVKSISNEEIARLRHPRFHILGRASMTPILRQRAYTLIEGNPDADVSCDANMIRKVTAEISYLQRKEIQEGEEAGLAWEIYDETELIYSVYNEANWMTRRQVIALAEFFKIFHPTIKPPRWVSHHAREALGELIETLDPEGTLLWQYGLRSVFGEEAMKELSARMRANAVEQVFGKAA